MSTQPERRQDVEWRPPADEVDGLYVAWTEGDVFLAQRQAGLWFDSRANECEVWLCIGPLPENAMEVQRATPLLGEMSQAAQAARPRQETARVAGPAQGLISEAQKLFAVNGICPTAKQMAVRIRHLAHGYNLAPSVEEAAVQALDPRPAERELGGRGCSRRIDSA